MTTDHLCYPRIAFLRLLLPLFLAIPLAANKLKSRAQSLMVNPAHFTLHAGQTQSKYAAPPLGKFELETLRRYRARPLKQLIATLPSAPASDPRFPQPPESTVTRLTALDTGTWI